MPESSLPTSRDRLSLRSLAVDEGWPPEDWLEDQFKGLSHAYVVRELAKRGFDVSNWVKYKSTVPNDGQKRIFTHPKIKYPLTREEYQAIGQKVSHPYMQKPTFYGGNDFCSPFLCPHRWGTRPRDWDEFDWRSQWLIGQWHWVEYGYPRPPQALWDSNQLFGEIFTQLVYEPFIKTWGNPSEDFWVFLSYANEQDNWDELNRGLVWVFHHQGRIFPSTSVYSEFSWDETKSYLSDPNTLTLAPEFWEWTQPPHDINDGVPFAELSPSEKILVRLMGESVGRSGFVHPSDLWWPLHQTGLSIETFFQVLRTFHNKGYLIVEIHLKGDYIAYICT